MIYCTKCGAQLNDGDKFCTKCGAAVKVEGQGSNTYSAPPIPPVSNQQYGDSVQNVNEVVSKTLSEVFAIFMSMLGKPASTVRYAINKLTIVSTAVLAAIVSIISGLLMMWSANKVFDGLGIDDFYSSGYLDSNIPYGKIFVSTMVGAFAISAFMALCIFMIGNFVLKKKVTFGACWSVISVSSIPVILTIFVGIVLSYISFTALYVIVIMGFIESVVCVYAGTKELIGSEDSSIFTVAVVYGATYFLAINIFIEKVLNGLD